MTARRTRALPGIVLGVASLVTAVLTTTSPSAGSEAAASVPTGASPIVTSTAPDASTRDPGSTASSLPPIRHVFVINLENKGYDQTWGPESPAPYLSQTLRAKGVLLSQYYGTAHNSLPNYIAQISGQGPNKQNQADCQNYTAFEGAGTVSPRQYVGDGCVFPSGVPTLPRQLQRAGLSWKGYMQDMGRPCRHPALGAVDSTQKAEVGDQYAARHNPFVYFAGITGSPTCAKRDVDLSRLPADLQTVASTPNLVYITPNLCTDGHDAPCVDGRPGGLVTADTWLQRWVPRIRSSPAFQRNGLLVITFDESEGAREDSSACCGEGPGPNTPLPGITGLGGGRVGALLLSPYIRPNTFSSAPYNHYSLLASIEDIFGLRHLGYARTPGLNRFGLDVYNR